MGDVNVLLTGGLRQSNTIFIKTYHSIKAHMHIPCVLSLERCGKRNLSGCVQLKHRVFPGILERTFPERHGCNLQWDPWTPFSIIVLHERLQGRKAVYIEGFLCSFRF